MILSVNNSVFFGGEGVKLEYHLEINHRSVFKLATGIFEQSIIFRTTALNGGKILSILRSLGQVRI